MIEKINPWGMKVIIPDNDDPYLGGCAKFEICKKCKFYVKKTDNNLAWICNAGVKLKNNFPRSYAQGMATFKSKLVREGFILPDKCVYKFELEFLNEGSGASNT